MPVEIDRAERLQTIAEATLQIVADDGLDGVSIRAVARRIGGSTTLVTNYLPTREALLRNAIEHAVREWDADMARAVQGTEGWDRLVAMAHWACTTTGDDLVLRRLFMEILGRGEPGSEALDVLKDDARRSREQLVAEVAAAGAGDPGFTADILLMVLRGFYINNLEDPERWNDARVAPLVERLLGVLIAVPERGVADGPQRIRNM